VRTLCELPLAWRRASKQLARLALLLPALLSSGCAAYLHQHLLATQPARLGAEVAGDGWSHLPAPRTKLVVAVYKFRDQTGQYKLLNAGASFSTVVTQGATSVLIRALDESRWFESIERENIGNLLNERKIIRSTQAEYTVPGQPPPAPLAPLLFATILLEGGIISYDTNLITGGGGLRYFGAGASGQYRQDRVTVYLRAISTNTGRVMKTVYTSKMILSQQVSAGLFQFVDFKRLLETETGFTYNEPSEMAVKEAIEKSVQSLVMEGIQAGYWTPRDTAERHGPAMRAYEREKTENLTLDALGRVERPRRGPVGVGLLAGPQRYAGAYAQPLLEPGGELTVRGQLSPAWSLFANVGLVRLAAGPNGSYFNQRFSYLEAGAMLRLLPRDRFTPLLLAGGGLTGRTSERLLSAAAPLPHLVGGLGAEYLLTDHLGLNATLDGHYFFSNALDGYAQGRATTRYWGGHLGLVLYLGHPPRK